MLHIREGPVKEAIAYKRNEKALYLAVLEPFIVGHAIFLPLCFHHCLWLNVVDEPLD